MFMTNTMTDWVFKTVARQACTLVYTTSDGAEFPVSYAAGETMRASIRVQRKDGRFEGAVATGRR
jgi:hypothetical protein